jgi:hypothetical protein
MPKLGLLAVALVPALFAMEENDVEFARPGGLSLRLDVKTPEGNGPFPTAIIVHGGGFARGNKRTYVTPSRPREFHPEPLTEPDVSLSTYPARAT